MERHNSFFMLLISVTQCAVISGSIISKHKISINKNGYEGIRIAIAQNIVYNQELIANLQKIFSASSAQLYKSTKNHLYFKDITIVVPKTWPTLPEYTSVSGPQFDMAHVIVDEVNDIVGSRPYVVDMMGCGEGGQHIHITPFTLLFQRAKGFLDKVMVHQWGHLRWGLFDEYPGTESPTLTEYKQHYVSDGTFKPNVCSDQISGKFLKSCDQPDSVCSLENGVPESVCIFCPDRPGNSTSSIMGYIDISSVDLFCDHSSRDVNVAERHNKIADTNQNRFCGGKSAWEVMRDHTDFKGLTPGTASQYTTPTFKIVQQGEQKVVLVLDISGSMSTQNRLDKLVQASTNFLLNVVDNNTKVGMVEFNNAAVIKRLMTPMSSMSIRQQYVNTLPSNANGGTSIGAGIRAGIKCLNDSGESTEGSVLLLVSDGKENSKPYIADVEPEIMSAGIVVMSLAFTKDSDIKMISLASNTSGRSFYYSGDDASTALVDAFAQSVERTGDTNNAFIMIKSESVTVTELDMYSSRFLIDSTVGKDTTITLSGTNLENVSLSATSPTFNMFSSGTCSGSTCKLEIPGLAEVGEYRFAIMSSSDVSSQVIFTIQSYQRSASIKVIKAKAWTSQDTLDLKINPSLKVYASVSRGRAPVLKATVKAFLQSVNQSIELYDEGFGSDAVADDGIYTAYILPSYVSENGRNSIKVSVSDSDGQALVVIPVTRRRRDAFQSVQLTTSSIDKFQRITQAGDFTVINYNSSLVAIDTIPPSKITSLTITSVQSYQFQMKFKAVGDDYDIGKATSYDIRISQNFQTLTNNPDTVGQLTPGIPNPKNPGEFETLSITLPDSSTYYVGIRAVDDEGNKGDLSNVVSISAITDTRWKTSTVVPSSVTTTAIKLNSGDPEGIIGLVLSATAVVVLSFVIVIAILLFKHRNRKEKLKRKKERYLRKHQRSYYDKQRFQPEVFAFPFNRRHISEMMYDPAAYPYYREYV